MLFWYERCWGRHFVLRKKADDKTERKTGGKKGTCGRRKIFFLQSPFLLS
jgi:hypothetical protein